MKALKLQKNMGYYIAGISALIASIVFFFVPFATEVIRYTMPAFPDTNSPFTTLFIEKGSEWTITATGNSTALGQINGVIWLNAVLAILILASSALLAFRSNPFGLMSVTVEKQVRWGNYALAAMALLSIIIQIGVFSDASQVLQGTNRMLGLRGQTGAAFYHASVEFGPGAWIFLLCMLAVIIGMAWPLLQKIPTQAATLRTRTWLPTRGRRSPYPSPTGQYPPNAPYPSPTGQYPPNPPYQEHTGQLAPEQIYQEQFPPTQPYPGGPIEDIPTEKRPQSTSE